MNSGIINLFGTGYPVPGHYKFIWPGAGRQLLISCILSRLTPFILVWGSRKGVDGRFGPKIYT